MNNIWNYSFAFVFVCCVKQIQVCFGVNQRIEKKYPSFSKKKYLKNQKLKSSIGKSLQKNARREEGNVKHMRSRLLVCVRERYALVKC